MENKKKNDSIVSLLLEAFDKGIKKSADQTLDGTEKKMSDGSLEEEIKSLTNAVKQLSDIVNHHNSAINELYLLQAHVLKQLKPTASSSIDSLGASFGTTKKNNDEKPN